MRKRVIAVQFALVIFLSAIGAYLVEWLKYGKRLTYSALDVTGRDESGCLKYPINPLFGFISGRCDDSKRNQRLGFTEEYSLEDNLLKNDSTYDVLILGGSVAADLKESSLRQYISKKTNKDVRIFNAALDGAKQPQGATTAAILDVLGYRWNAIVELSGFNEIALNLTENYPNGTSLIYPRDSVGYIQKTGWILNRPAIFYPFQRLLWEHPLQRIMVRSGLYRLVGLLARPDAKKQASDLGLTYRQATTEEEAFRQAKMIYVGSARSIQLIAKARKSRYLLVLQPNQHQHGSKKLTILEQKVSIPKSMPLYEWADVPQQDLEYSRVINRYYSRLSALEFGPDIEVFDARDVFRGENRTLYVDTCCHLNAEGMNIIAKRISDKLGAR